MLGILHGLAMPCVSFVGENRLAKSATCILEVWVGIWYRTTIWSRVVSRAI